MALTKVTGSVIKDNVSLSGNVSVGGTLTYQDVTNVDALGIGTFRTGIKVLAGQVDVGSNIKLGNAGVITATSFSGVMSGTTGSFSGQVNVGSNIKLGTAGVITATSFSGSGANLTGLNSDVVSDTSPQLGANLDTNTKCIDFGDSNTGTVNRLRFGASTDFEIFHNGTNNYIDCHTAGQDLYIRPTKDVYIQDYSTDDIHIKMIKDGAVELYHNDVKKFETAADRVNITGHIFILAGNRLYLQNGFNNSVGSINNTGGSNDSNLNFHVRNAGTESTALKIQKNGNIELPVDSQVLNLGASQDMQLYHNGTDSYILNATGNFRIGQYNNANLKFFTSNSTRWEINGSGHFLPDANNSFDIGSTSLRVRNIYTNDLNLSNEGSTNSVDNTWGNYTIQEGESELYLINNRNGKKYKFNLTEVL